MSSKKKRKKKLRKQLKKREREDSLAVVVCVGKKCADRARSRAVVDAARSYAEATHPLVHVERVGCLHICKKGPLVATYPRIKFYKKVDEAEVRELIDKVARSDESSEESE